MSALLRLSLSHDAEWRLGGVGSAAWPRESLEPGVMGPPGFSGFESVLYKVTSESRSLGQAIKREISGQLYSVRAGPVCTLAHASLRQPYASLTPAARLPGPCTAHAAGPR